MKLSIIVPVYNVEGYLAKCLDSLICAGQEGYEIICVDDGSTDGSGAIARAYSERYPALIRVIRQENGGLGAARNTGIDAARGEYLLFVDSDDCLSDGAISEIFETLSSDFDIYLFDIVSVSPSGKKLGLMRGCEAEGGVSLASCPELLFQPPAACNKLFRRSLFTESGIRFPGRVWYEDLRTTPKLYLYTARIISLRKSWYSYLQRPGSITNSADAGRNMEIIGAVDDLLDFYKSRGAYDGYKEALEYLAFYNQFLTASVRVCLVDPDSPVLAELREDFIRKFPDFMQNRYVKNIGAKHRLLTRLLLRRQFRAVRLIMRLNALIKRGG